MADRVKIKTNENYNIHFNTHKNDYTLCGLDTMGDPTIGIGKPKSTTMPVNCPECIWIVEFCHEIKKNEFV